MTIYDRFGISTVINAAGKLTALGGTAQDQRVAQALAEAAGSHVDLSELRAAAGEIIAARCNAEAASVTAGAAAGIAIGVAACVAGADAERVARLPDSDGWLNAVIVQAGHWVNFGAPVEQMIRLGGGRPVMVGGDEGLREEKLHESLHRPVAALLYVQSHHASQTGQVPLEGCVRLAQEHNVPVIVDAAAEGDLGRYIAAGVDLVTYSGGKAIGGPTVGFIAGRQDLVTACEAQQHGIARTMKVGKEQIMGLLVALELYNGGRSAGDGKSRANVTATIRTALEGLPGVEVTLRPDEAGRPIERVAASATDRAFDVHELVAFLRSGRPSIRTRNHQLKNGIVQFDPRELSEAQAEIIASRLREFFARED
jgi:D-glucosaminate-6-phosphate ammonia-lyase